MRKLLVLTSVILTVITTRTSGQCTSLFSFAAYFNTVSFINQSTVSNAHYFWNFGDGTGSNLASPIHTFPDNGDYLVTLFSNDTVNNCSSYYEYWVNVTKYSIAPCQPSISDSISSSSNPVGIYVYSTSTNCNGYNVLLSGANFANFAPNNGANLSGWNHFHIVCLGLYYDSSGNPVRAAYKTAYYNYSSSHNYGDSSANFEFTVVSQDSSGERILFKAMNRTAISYKWYISGFGAPISSNYDTISQIYPYTPNIIWQVGLMTQGKSSYLDTIYQNIVAIDSTKTIEGVNDLQKNNESVTVYPNPSNGTFTFSLSNIHIACNVEIYNILGENIYTTKLNHTTTQLDLGNNGSGVYLYRVLTETGSLVSDGKLTIQK